MTAAQLERARSLLSPPLDEEIELLLLAARAPAKHKIRIRSEERPGIEQQVRSRGRPRGNGAAGVFRFLADLAIGSRAEEWRNALLQILPTHSRGKLLEEALHQVAAEYRVRGVKLSEESVWRAWKWYRAWYRDLPPEERPDLPSLVTPRQRS